MAERMALRFNTREREFNMAKKITFTQAVLSTGFEFPTTIEVATLSALAARGGSGRAKDLAYELSMAKGAIVSEAPVYDTLKKLTKHGHIVAGPAVKEEGNKGKPITPYSLTERGNAFLASMRSFMESANGTEYA